MTDIDIFTAVRTSDLVHVLSHAPLGLFASSAKEIIFSSDQQHQQGVEIRSF
jgi:hypothetical protein